MSLLFIDGFDHYTGNADLAKKWDSVSSSFPTVSATSGRRSGGALSCQASSIYYCQKNIPATSTVIVGFAGDFRGTNKICGLVEAAVEHVYLYYNISTLKIQIYNGSGTLLATSNATVPSSRYAYVELKCTISSTTGSYYLRINGVDDVSATGVNTRNGGTVGVCSSVKLYGATSGYIDDFYICDTSGTTNNNFLGDCRIDTVYPTSDGNYSQFTPSTAGAHWPLVDETAPNTTDYVSSATVGQRDSYGFPDLAPLTINTVYGVQVNLAAMNSDAGARSAGTMARLGTTDKDGAGKTLNASQIYVSEVYETDPSNAAWTLANFNLAEFGVKVTA